MRETIKSTEIYGISCRINLCLFNGDAYRVPSMSWAIIFSVSELQVDIIGRVSHTKVSFSISFFLLLTCETLSRHHRQTFSHLMLHANKCLNACKQQVITKTAQPH